MGGSGGGSAGDVSWPDYLQTVHNDWLDNTGVDTLTNSVTAAMEAAYGNSPFTTSLAFDPTSDVTSMNSAVTALNTVVDALDHKSDFDAAMVQAKASIETMLDIAYLTLDETTITNYIDSFEDERNDQFDNKELPSFRAGLLDIGAVQSSAFVVGESIMRGFKLRDISRFENELRYRLYEQDREIAVKHFTQKAELISRGTAVMIQSLMTRINFEGSVAGLTIESKRIGVVAGKEEIDQQLDILEKDSVWDLETFQYGANIMAAISGGVIQTQKRPSKAQSALGGALSGAALGAQVSGGDPYATAAGAAIGAGLAFL